MRFNSDEQNKARSFAPHFMHIENSAPGWRLKSTYPGDWNDMLIFTACPNPVCE